MAEPQARAVGWDRAALVLTAGSTGVLIGTLAALGPSTSRFSPPAYVEVQQATVRNLRR